MNMYYPNLNQKLVIDNLDGVEFSYYYYYSSNTIE